MPIVPWNNVRKLRKKNDTISSLCQWIVSVCLIDDIICRGDSGIVYLDGVSPPKPPAPQASAQDDPGSTSSQSKGSNPNHQKLLQTIREQDEGGESR